jgi:hypothetical protein
VRQDLLAGRGEVPTGSDLRRSQVDGRGFASCPLRPLKEGPNMKISTKVKGGGAISGNHNQTLRRK